MVEPQLSEVLTRGGQVVASNQVDTAPDLTVAMYFTAVPVIDRDPDLVKRFAEAVDESLRYAAGHPEKVRATVGPYTKISDVVRASLDRLAARGRTDGPRP